MNGAGRATQRICHIVHDAGNVVNVHRDAGTLLAQEEGTENGTEARCHGESFPAGGLRSRVVATKTAMQRQVAVTQKLMQQEQKRALSQKLP